MKIFLFAILLAALTAGQPEPKVATINATATMPMLTTTVRHVVTPATPSRDIITGMVSRAQRDRGVTHRSASADSSRALCDRHEAVFPIRSPPRKACR